MTVYLATAQVRALHEALVRQFGGSQGIRDAGALEAALARPAMTFGGEDLYPDVHTKAGALLHSLVLNHAFVDGNKRAGVAAAELFLQLNGWLLDATDEEFEVLTLDTAQGNIEPEALAIWFRQHSRPM
ncbi:MAG: type II toxin-antitoxin system death-on-curing family toxin [Luteitalea sp.]|nr:type II toxin-antitoxin system death-on-curing family toxin [Luteitalea sp.]